jgi:hypothetical protein
MGNGGTAPLLLTSVLDGGEWLDSRSAQLIPREDPPVPIVWASEQIWTLWIRGKSLSFPGIELRLSSP